MPGCIWIVRTPRSGRVLRYHAERGNEGLVLFCGGCFAVEAVLFEFFVEGVAVDAEAGWRL